MAEYRWLAVKDGGDKQGLLLGVDRDVGRNFRIGVGYNFTRFSDDLTDFDYDHEGLMTGGYWRKLQLTVVPVNARTIEDNDEYGLH